jgi:hypothetical protein
MLESRKEKTVIAKALKIVGSVTQRGLLVEVNGQIDGELWHVLVISHGGGSRHGYS